MSGIYIPGVTVPEDNTILLRIFPKSDGIYYTEQLDIDEDILDKFFAIPVPEHGRLIDADATEIYKREEQALARYSENEDDEFLEGVKDGWHEAAKCLSCAPTIIRADKEGEK